MLAASEDDTWGVLAFSLMSFCDKQIYLHIVGFLLL